MAVGVKTSPTALLPSGTDFPQYSASTSGSKFIPEIWSGKLQVKFYKSTVLGDITNNDWEGEIKGQGDKVYIRSIPSITIRDYTKGTSLTNEAPTSTPVELTIDKGKYFSVVMDDVDAGQSDVRLMDVFTNDAAEQMKITIDSDVLNAVDSDVPAANKGATAGALTSGINLGASGSAVAITSSIILTSILNVGQALDEQNVPETGRWMVVPSWMLPILKNSELRQAYLTGDNESPLRNGKVGIVDRFTIYVSNNYTGVTDGSDTCYHVLAGTKDAVSFASQMNNVETIRSESTFGNIVRGLNVYGYKTVKPEALVDLYCKNG